MSRGLQRAIVIILALTVLEAATRLGWINDVTMIPPTLWLTSLIAILRAGSANADIVFTGSNIVIASVISVVGGVIIGLALHAVPRLRHAFAPILASYYAVPVFALYPLLIGILGINAKPLIAIGAMFGIVAVIIATLNGLDRVPAVFLKSAAAMGLGYWPTFFVVRLPAMLPHLMSGFKLAVAYSVIGVIAGEFILASRGLGRAIAFAYNNFDNPTMYALLLLVITLTIVINLALSTWEQAIFRRWQR